MHETAVETQAVGGLPDIFNAGGVGSYKAIAKGRKGPLHRRSVSFQASLTPTHRAVVCFHADEQPTGRHAKRFNFGNGAHDS
jgi:hypothetical protein